MWSGGKWHGVEQTRWRRRGVPKSDKGNLARACKPRVCAWGPNGVRRTEARSREPDGNGGEVRVVAEQARINISVF